MRQQITYPTYETLQRRKSGALLLLLSALSGGTVGGLVALALAADVRFNAAELAVLAALVGVALLIASYALYLLTTSIEVVVYDPRSSTLEYVSGGKTVETLSTSQGGEAEIVSHAFDLQRRDHRTWTVQRFTLKLPFSTGVHVFFEREEDRIRDRARALSDRTGLQISPEIREVKARSLAA